LGIAHTIDPDFTADRLLAHAELLEADEFQHGKEGDHDLCAARGIRKKFLEADRNSFLRDLQDMLDFFRDGEIFRENLPQVLRLFFKPLENF
jgi:hypothetical protein